MEWDKEKRPPPDICPREFCFHWVVPGGFASPPGKTYRSRQEMLEDSVNWPMWPDGGCACPFGRCTRLDGVTGDADFYESHGPNLERAGLPWFYFNTLENLRAEFHQQFLRESEQLWGSAERDNSEPGASADRPRE
jgi:hypothetical protein